MSASSYDRLRAMLPAIAPGTELRDGLDRILHGRTGAIVVLGYDESVEEICSGGFTIDVEFSPARLRELAKMDGATVVDYANNRIRRANVQLIPNPTIETRESGMRHRTAARAAQHLNYPVISVSQSMQTIALFVDDMRYVVEDPETILARANQAIATLERYRARLDEAEKSLTLLEIEELVTLRDVAFMLHRSEGVTRIGAEVSGYVQELGTEGRLLQMQLKELMSGVGSARHNVIRDYLPDGDTREPAQVLKEIAAIDAAALSDLQAIAEVLKITSDLPNILDAPLTARGYRFLSKIPRIPAAVIELVVGRLGPLPHILGAHTDDFLTVEGVGPRRSRTIRESLARLVEATISS